MITVVSYLAGIPPNNKNPEKPRSLINFIKGVNAVGDRGILNDKQQLVSAGVAIIQGYVHEESKNAPLLAFRKQILDHQRSSNNRTIIIDSNLFLYRDPGNSRGYLRYSYDGIFPNTGEYCNSLPDPVRWEQIKKALNIDLQPWRKSGKHILICLQRKGGWSMRGLDVIEFFNQIVSEIRKFSDRPILVRTHPGDKKSITYSRSISGKNVTLSTNNSLVEDLRNAWATVVYNSSPGVASIIEGVPAFVIDPVHSQALEVCNTDLAKIENPLVPERLDWIRKLAQCHWNDHDLLSGDTWKHMRQWALRQ